MLKRGSVVVEKYQRDGSLRTDYTGRRNARQTDAVADYALGIPQTT